MPEQIKKEPIDTIREGLGIAADVPLKVQRGTNEKIFFNNIGDESTHKNILDQSTANHIVKQLDIEPSREPPQGKRSALKITMEKEPGNPQVYFRQEADKEVSISTFDPERVAARIEANLDKDTTIQSATEIQASSVSQDDAASRLNDVINQTDPLSNFDKAMEQDVVTEVMPVKADIAKDEVTEVMPAKANVPEAAVVGSVKGDEVTWEAFEAALKEDMAKISEAQSEKDKQLSAKFNKAFDNTINKIETSDRVKAGLNKLKNDFTEARQAFKATTQDLKQTAVALKDQAAERLKITTQEAAQKFNRSFNNVMDKVDVTPQVKSTLGQMNDGFTQFKDRAIDTAKQTGRNIQATAKQVVEDPGKAAATAAGATARTLGDTFEKAGEKLEEAGTWLSELPDRIENHNVARDAIKAVERGEQRISTDHFDLDSGHRIGRQAVEGGERYYVSSPRPNNYSAEPVASLTFQVDDKGKISDIGKFSDYDSKAFREASKADVIRAADSNLEAKHAAASNRAAVVAENVLNIKDVNKDAGQNYVFERSEQGELTISSKQSGKVLLQKDAEGNVSSNLNATDFKKFDAVIQKTQAAMQDQTKEASQQSR